MLSFLNHPIIRIVFLSVVFLFSYFFIFKVDFKNTDLNVKNSELSTQIQTPCRKVNQNSAFQALEDRVTKLNRLMDESIDWVFKDINGEVIDMYCLREKKIIVLNFWATWCAPCIKELPSLAILAESYKDQILVIAISTESTAEITHFLDQYFDDLSLELKVVSLSEAEKLKYFPKDSLLPATYIFNKKGLLKIKTIGDRDWSNKKIVEQILSLNK